MKQKLFSRSDIESQFGSLSTAEGKKKLAEYALKNYGVKLVRNKSFENMMNDFENTIIASTEEARKNAGDAKEQIDLDERVDFSDSVELDPDKMDIDDVETGVNSKPVDEIVKMLEEPAPVVQEIEAKQLVEPGEIRSINDIPPEDQEKIRAGLSDGTLVIEGSLPIAEKEYTVSFPEGYTPKYRLVGPEGRAFINLPYWVHDWMQGRNWRIEIAECPYDKELLKSLAFYIERDGSVAIRESRNSKFIVIS